MMREIDHEFAVYRMKLALFLIVIGVLFVLLERGPVEEWLIQVMGSAVLIGTSLWAWRGAMTLQGWGGSRGGAG